MKNYNQDIETLFKKSKDDILVPSREAFQDMLASVTKPVDVRSTGQEGMYHNVPSPYQQFMRNKIVISILATGAVLALILVVSPRYTHVSTLPGQAVENKSMDESAQQYGVILPPADSHSEIDLAVRDILLDGIDDVQTAQADHYQDDTADTATDMDDIESYQI